VLTLRSARIHPADPDSMYCCCTIHGRCGAPGRWPTHHSLQKRRRPSGREHRPRCPTPARRPPGKPPITCLRAMGRRPHTEPRVVAFVVADTIRSGHHPVALRCVTERAATALQRSPLGLGRAESDCLLAAHSRSQAFESPGGPRSEERTRHRTIIPAARDLPLLAMLVTETVTSLGPLSSAPGFLPERRLLAGVSTRDFSRQNPEAPAYPSTDGFVALFGTVSVSIHRQALAGLSWLSSSPPAVSAGRRAWSMPGRPHRCGQAPHGGSG